MRIFNAIKFIMLCFSFTALLSSCFKEEPLNQECDIETARIHTDNPQSLFYDANDTLLVIPSDVNEIKFWIRPGADVTAMAPIFTITPGAKITPENGSVHDFSNGPVKYNLVSEDGNYHRTYMVSFNTTSKTSKDTLCFDFEDYEIKNNSYYIWINKYDTDELKYAWSSGNAGFKLSHSNAKPEEYPSVAISDGGLDGACVKLETRSTGKLGESVGMPIAAGNLFLGKFDVGPALSDGRKATTFGVKFDKKPIKFTGYYKYRPGDVYKDKHLNVISDKKDHAAIYSVMYRNKDENGNDVVLNGHDIKDSKYIVAYADMRDINLTEEWTPFEITYDYYKEIDEEILLNKGYSFTLVFSSSYMGDLFEGAIGSTLMVDKVKVICAQ